MKYFWKINVYEIQALLYWILGVLILHLGEWHFFGWLAIGWGWFTFLHITVWAIKNIENVRKEWEVDNLKDNKD